MPYFIYVKLASAAAMVKKINEASTLEEHRDAQLRCEGYVQRCEEMGQRWPGCGLDILLAETDSSTGEPRPTCCGEFLDWEPTHAN